ncbi:hypothetical protein U1Q18_006227 [Sarracenia purpurea var. burkii]
MGAAVGRRATDLEPLQPLLKKCIGFLETEVFPSTVETSRPRVQLERVTIWLGIKALLGFLEPPAFEEGILERYPIFLSISLEALQDGEHEKQRRHVIYFLLHQVTVSSNFSILMRKKACQIAILIIHRGYKMIPSCPPFECPHMWGPCLVSSLKDSSLHNSLRQPAFDLIQTIIVSDAAVLVTSMLNRNTPPTISKSMSSEFNDEDEDGLLFARDGEEEESCWKEFSVQSRVSSQEFGEWKCIPMLWFDVLVEIDPLVLPVSFSKAVFWALSRLSMVEPDNTTQMALPAGYWLSTCASEISHLFGWKVPTGSDDGGDGKESKNSIKVSTVCGILIKTFKRLAAHYVVQMEQGELRKQWTWEPRMSESLILLLVDPDDVQMDCVLLNFQTLHHFFFVLCKLLKEGFASSPTLPGNSSDDPSMSRFSSQGGFLRHPVFDSVPNNVDLHLANADLSVWEEFSCLIAGIAWPSIQKCLAEGKAFIDHKISQMTCIRLLEILPVVFERLLSSFHKVAWNSRMMFYSFIDYKWLNDLADWGRSSLAVIVRYWKQTVVSLVGLLKQSCSDSYTSVIRGIEKLMSYETIAMDELREQVSCLSVLLYDGGSSVVKDMNLKSDALVSEDLSFRRKFSAQDAKPSSSEDVDVQILDSVSSANKRDIDAIIVLSDDETQMEVSANEAFLSNERASQCVLGGKTAAAEGISHGDLAKMNVSTNDTSEDPIGDFQRADAPDRASFVPQKLDSDTLSGKLDPAHLVKPKAIVSNKKDVNIKRCVNDFLSFHCNSNLRNSSGETVSSKSMDQECINKSLETSDNVIKELVRDAEDDPWEFGLKSSRRQQSYAMKSSTSGPKRQVIKLNLTVENRSGYLRRLEGGVKRFKPPKLDEWYRPILEIDYFATVGLASASEKDNQTASKLKEVPVSFQSPDQYVDIFRPLVLEEFKAQLNNTSSSEEMCCGTLSILSVERIDDFHFVRCVHDDGDPAGSRSFSENDLILFTRQPLQNSSHDVHVVGKKIIEFD